MIVVTGANGPFGRLVVEQLLTRVDPAGLAVSVRDPAVAGALADRGVSVRKGDFDRPETLPAAFDGAATVLVNGTDYGTDPDVRGRRHAAAIRAAERAGAGRIVLTGWPDPARNTLAIARDFPGTEALLTASATGWTVLRMVYGMAVSLARDVVWAQRAGELAAPAGDARATPAAVTDLAEAAATVLTDDGHTGRTYELTCPDAIGWDDLAALAATRAGRPIRYRPESDEQFRGTAVAAGFRAAAVDPLLDYYRGFRSGWASTPSADLAGLLGRPPVASLDAVAQAADSWPAP